jgi:hypothetical protein
MKITAILTFCMLCYCSVAGQAVEVKTDKNYDVGKLRTYSLEDGDLILVMKSEADEAKLKTEIRNAISRDLNAKGYTKSEQEADFKITFVAEIVERTEQEDVGPLGQVPARTGADLDQSQTWSQEVRRGSLAIEIMDGKTNKTVWRASSSINFRSTDLNEVLQAAVSRGLRKFPKQKK